MAATRVLACQNASQRDLSESISDCLRSCAPVSPGPPRDPVEHPQKSKRGKARVEIVSHNAGLPAFGEEIDPEMLIAAPKGPKFREAFLRQFEPLDQRDREPREPFLKHSHVRGEGSGDPILDGSALANNAVEQVIRFSEGVYDDLLEEILLARDVVVQATFEDTQLIGDVFNGRGSIAPPPEDAGRSVKDFLSRPRSPRSEPRGFLSWIGLHARESLVDWSGALRTARLNGHDGATRQEPSGLEE